MTNEEALDIIEKSEKCYIEYCPDSIFCDECPWNVKQAEYDEAIKTIKHALSKQCASSEQADKSVIVDFVAFQREWLNSHKTLELDAVNNALVNIFLETTGKAFINSLGQTAENDEDRTRDDEGPKLFGKRTIIEPGEEFIGEDLLKEALDQSADSDKMVDLKMRTITERLIIAESLINSVIVDSDQFREDAKKTDFKPGDKFILELGAERKMFDEFEIAGTDLYVKISLLEKLTRYEPEKFEIHNDHTDCIWYHYLDDDDDVPNTCPSTCSQYRDGWNDAMKYIYCDGKGYQPYTRKAK